MFAIRERLHAHPVERQGDYISDLITQLGYTADIRLNRRNRTFRNLQKRIFELINNTPLSIFPMKLKKHLSCPEGANFLVMFRHFQVIIPSKYLLSWIFVNFFWFLAAKSGCVNKSGHNLFLLCHIQLIFQNILPCWYVIFLSEDWH